MSVDGSGSGSRITVSEDTLRRILAEFKLELIDELKSYVRVIEFEALKAEVKALQLWQAGIVGAVTAKRQISAATFAWASLAVGALTALATFVWLHHG